MSKTIKTVMAVATTGAFIASGTLTSAALADQHVDAVGSDSGIAQDDASARTGFTRVNRAVEGTFSYNQDVTFSNAELRKAVFEGSDHLCGSADQEELSAQEIKDIRVQGDVEHAFTANIADYEKKAPAKRVMGCTCAGNPNDGRASANAEVEGFLLKSLIADAKPSADANTITLYSADGYKVALPLSYVTQRYSIIVTGINGESVSSAVGSGNQLWLGSVSARYFARDIVRIDITAESEAPEIPQSPADVNQPNVGVLSAEVAQ